MDPIKDLIEKAKQTSKTQKEVNSLDERNSNFLYDGLLWFYEEILNFITPINNELPHNERIRCGFLGKQELVVSFLDREMKIQAEFVPHNQIRPWSPKDVAAVGKVHMHNGKTQEIILFVLDEESITWYLKVGKQMKAVNPYIKKQEEKPPFVELDNKTIEKWIKDLIS